MAVRIVTDSTAYLSPELVEKYDITVIPFHVRIGDRAYLDGVDLDEETFHRDVYAQGMKPSTMSPSVAEFQRVYEDLNRETGSVITILLSTTLSKAYENARRAADTLLGRCQIEVIDSRSVSVGLGILVELAARAAAEGQSIDEIVRLVRGVIPHIYVVFFSDTLAYLERGGRIGRAQALLGTILGIRPFLTLEEGEIMPIEKVRTREQALEKLLEFVMEFDAIKQLAIIKGDSRPSAETEAIVERLQGQFPDVSVPVLSYGSVLASHIGPDTMGMIVYESYDV
jgi:fatty acid kinase fatty acid binding subunit